MHPGVWVDILVESVQGDDAERFDTTNRQINTESRDIWVVIFKDVAVSDDGGKIDEMVSMKMGNKNSFEAFNIDILLEKFFVNAMAGIN